MVGLIVIWCRVKNIVFLLASSCSLHGPHVGLIDDGRLITNDGKHICLIKAEAPIIKLDGCRVELKGPKIGRLVYVKDWRVTDAGDGSEPFVGILWKPALKMIIEDRNSGTPIYISPQSVEVLKPYIGHLVMLSGYIVGVQELLVVQYTILD